MAATLMIIDDDDDDRELFYEAVTSIDEKYTCMMAVSGEQAIELLREPVDHEPDLIFLDLNMPRMNGKQCLIKLRQFEHLSHIPIIIYSTSKIQRDVEE